MVHAGEPRKLLSRNHHRHPALLQAFQMLRREDRADQDHPVNPLIVEEVQVSEFHFGAVVGVGKEYLKALPFQHRVNARHDVADGEGIDFRQNHPYGLGLPCTEDLGLYQRAVSGFLNDLPDGLLLLLGQTAMVQITGHGGWRHACQLCDFSNARFTAMLDEIVSRELSGDLSSVCPRRDIDGITVCELPPTLYAFFLLCHKATHVIEDGLGLRQVCDWAVFLSAEHERIDRNKFASWTSGLRLWPLAHAFGRICVDDLRLPESCLPFRLVRETGNYELLRRQILSGGNFGRLFYRYKGHVGKKEDMLRTMCVKMPRYASLYRLWPDEARWCYWAMLKRGVRRLAGR